MEEDQPQEIFQSPPEYQSRLSRQSSGGGSAKRYIAIIVIVIVVAVIILGIFRFFTGGSESTEDLTPTPTLETFPTDTPFPTETPAEESPTPSPKVTPSTDTTTTPKPGGTTSSIDKATGLDRAKLSVHVFNGSGVTGAAKKATDFLEGLGYNVVDFDNAESSDYASTEIQVITSKSDYAALLKKDLSANYTVGKTTDTPASGEPADAVVIIGK
jgi:hypothetical protein